MSNSPELSFPFQGKSVNVTASFGVAGFHGNDLGEFSALVHEADQMLYEATHAGRKPCESPLPMKA